MFVPPAHAPGDAQANFGLALPVIVCRFVGRRRCLRFLCPSGPIAMVSPPHSHPSIRMAIPALAMCRLASPTVKVPKWKIDAASTALAWPILMPSTR